MKSLWYELLKRQCQSTTKKQLSMSHTVILLIFLPFIIVLAPFITCFCSTHHFPQVIPNIVLILSRCGYNPLSLYKWCILCTERRLMNSTNIRTFLVCSFYKRTFICNFSFNLSVIKSMNWCVYCSYFPTTKYLFGNYLNSSLNSCTLGNM